MDKRELEKRTKTFALRVVRFVSGLPKSKVTNSISDFELRIANLGLRKVISNFEFRISKW